MSQDQDFYFRLPKVELHAHLNGSISMKTIEKLMALDKERTVETPRLLEQPSTMDEVFKLFPLIQAVTSTPEAAKIATMSVIADFAAENTVYLELRTTPKDRPGFSKEEYVEAVTEGIRASSSLPIVVRLLLSIDRRQSIEEAEITVKMATADRSGLIVGVELSGDPSVDGRKFLPVLREARKAKLRVAVHLAEVDSCLDEVDDFLSFRPDRIGHGTYLHTRPQWVERLVKQKIPFEICLTSNYLSKTTATVADSHLTFWRERGVPVAISTDDMGLMGITFTGEFRLAAQTFSLSHSDVIRIVYDTIRAAFLDWETEEFRRIKEKLQDFFSNEDLF